MRSLRSKLFVLLISALTAANAAHADDVKILKADLRNSGGDRWSLSVTLRHADEGWAHYADAWRVVDSEGTVLGTRILHHPHVEEQPFTRSLAGVAIPPGSTTLFIEARDTVHGWTGARLRVDLDAAVEGRLVVEAGH